MPRSERGPARPPRLSSPGLTGRQWGAWKAAAARGCHAGQRAHQHHPPGSRRPSLCRPPALPSAPGVFGLQGQGRRPTAAAERGKWPTCAAFLAAGRATAGHTGPQQGGWKGALRARRLALYTAPYHCTHQVCALRGRMQQRGAPGPHLVLRVGGGAVQGQPRGLGGRAIRDGAADSARAPPPCHPARVPNRRTATTPPRHAAAAGQCRRSRRRACRTRRQARRHLLPHW
mmetsp:Transcript_34312/g.86104  ORF Transcript_34312/g.86104 Transcript_34312/m.86104 type:complete len:230 (+) Transcript_34312:213-902(+)